LDEDAALEATCHISRIFELPAYPDDDPADSSGLSGWRLFGLAQLVALGTVLLVILGLFLWREVF